MTMNGRSTLRFDLPAVMVAIVFATTMFAQDSKKEPSAQPFSVDVPPPSDNYLLGPDSQRHSGVPVGQQFSFSMPYGGAMSGSRSVSVYVPAQYDGKSPACILVELDSLSYNTPTVLDNLIDQRAMPVTIAIGVGPGTVSAALSKDNPRYDRSFEFDSMTDRLATLIVDEVLPAVSQHTTADGRKLILSDDPNDRAIAGGSTGGIGAFTVAWERPDQFRRVFTSIGTFVGMRGGETYNVLVRKTEPKPIRIFMQDGAHDEWMGGPEMGDWWMSNLTMARALEFAGYDVRHVWGAGTHNGSQAASVFPDAMRWLWRNWPEPLKATKQPGNPVLKAILNANEDWRVAVDRCTHSLSLTADPNGTVYFPVAEDLTLRRVDAGACNAVTPADTILAFGADGRIYRNSSSDDGSIVMKDNANIESTVARGLQVSGMVVTGAGLLYVTTHDTAGKGEVWLIPSNGRVQKVASGLKRVTGVALSPDGQWMFVSQQDSRWSYSFRVQPDGRLDQREAFYDLVVPASSDDSGAASVVMDRDGRAYVATRLGVQVMDHNGRVIGILPMPNHLAATSLCFGGKDFSVLYVAAGDKVYARRLMVPGLPPASQAVKVPNFGGG